MNYLYFLLFSLFVVKAYGQNTIKVCPSCEFSTIQEGIKIAKDGDTILVEKGIYLENELVITKSIHLIGRNFPVINGQKKGNILTFKETKNISVKGFVFSNVGFSATSENAAIKIEKVDSFSIENNTITNAYFGIILNKGKNGKVQNNQIKGIQKNQFNTGNAIHLWSCKNMYIADNELTTSRDGIYIQFSSQCIIKRNSSYNNLRYGLHFMFSNDNEYIGNNFENNGAGVAVMFSKRITMKQNIFQQNWGPSSYGMLLKEIYDSQIHENLFYKNTIGINGENCTRVDYSGNIFSENGWGIRIKGGCYANHFWENHFENNSFDVAYDNKVNDNTFKDNYWSDYTGYDLNKDGVGDVPYRPVKLFSYIANKVPESIVLLRSLFIDIVNFSEKVAPVFTPENLIDNSPRMKSFLNYSKEDNKLILNKL